MSSCSRKDLLRKELASIRRGLSHQRRAAARASLLTTLYPRLHLFRSILSFCSLDAEIDMSALNQLLATDGRLTLPKVEGDRLDLFHVAHLADQLKRYSWQGLEPIPEVCQPRSLETIDCVLVPGLGFDLVNMRIGYGKGYYDRLIAQARNAGQKTPFIGIGFHEQRCTHALPFEPHDQALDQLVLV